jgi:phosphatidylinositol alpha-1,6-mannosyltransferase
MPAKKFPGKGCLLVTNTFPPAVGGSSQVYAALAEFADGDVAVLTSTHDHQTGFERPGWAAFDGQAGYPIHRLKFIRPVLGKANPRPKLLSRAAEILIVLNLTATVALLACRYRASTICIADDETVGWLTLISRYVLRCRTLIYCHGDDLKCSEEIVRRRRRWFRLADNIVAANRYAEAQLTTVFGIANDKIILVRNGVDLKNFYPAPPPISYIEHYDLTDKRVLLTVSRLVPRKGIDQTLKALPAVAKRFPNIIYLVVGDGPQRTALEAIAQKLEISNLVKFVGSVEHSKIRNFYNAAEIVLHPNRVEDSESDGLPLVFLEANACGKPIIGGAAGGTGEVVSNGENGIIVDGLNITEIESAICTLLGNETLRNTMGQKGLLMARNWGWEARAQLFMDTCRK